MTSDYTFKCSPAEFNYLSKVIEHRSNEALKKLLTGGPPFCRLLMVDLLCFFYSARAERLDMRQVSLGLRLNVLIVERLVNSKEIQGLRLATVGDESKAFFAAVETLVQILANLPRQLIEVSGQLAQKVKLQNTLECQKGFLTGAVSRFREDSTGGKVKCLTLSALRDLGTKLVQTAGQVNFLRAQLMRMWYSGEASRLSKGVNESGIADVIEADDHKKVPVLERYLTTAAKFSANPKVQKIANQALAAGCIPRKIIPEPKSSVASGITVGNNLELLLPEEWVKFFWMPSKKRFFADLVEEKLWMVDLDEGSDLGPLIICLDCSGSMQGKREETAKGIAMAMLAEAGRHNRDCFVLLFGGAGCIRVITCRRGRVSEQDVLDIAHSFFSSPATDFTGVLKEAAKYTTGHRRSDMLLLTDGYGSLDPKTIREIRQLVAADKLVTWTVLLRDTVDHPTNIERISNYVYYGDQVTEAGVDNVSGLSYSY